MKFKRILFVFLLISFGFASLAQENYFVYLQTENGKPFYVRMDNRLFSSTTAGYLILPKLKEGEYEISVGFPKNEYAEEKFKIDINEKSQGFLLKNFGEEGWSLFNLQTLALISPGASATETSVAGGTPVLKEDRFSQVLATVLNDSTLLRKDEPLTKKPVSQEMPVANKSAGNTSGVTETVTNSDPNLPAESLDTEKPKEAAVAKAEDQINRFEKEDTDVARSQIIYNPESIASSSISRVLSVTGRDGSEMIYLDKGDVFTDTIRVFIPRADNDNVELTQQSATSRPADVEAEPAFTITPTVIPPSDPVPQADVQPEKKPETKTDINAGSAEEKKSPGSQVFIIRDDTAREKKSEKEDAIIMLPRTSGATTNSDCKDLATESDYMKIRRKMAAERNMADMIAAARKIFRKKCFNTDQVRNLSYLFFEDEGRYMFFDAIYPHTSDSENFQSLVSQLSDEYYINRFKAMLLKP